MSSQGAESRCINSVFKSPENGEKQHQIDA